MPLIVIANPVYAKFHFVKMTVEEFRAIALSFPESEERTHMNHPDFRVGGKIFATISPDGCR